MKLGAALPYSPKAPRAGASAHAAPIRPNAEAQGFGALVQRSGENDSIESALVNWIEGRGAPAAAPRRAPGEIDAAMASTIAGLLAQAAPPSPCPRPLGVAPEKVAAALVTKPNTETTAAPHGSGQPGACLESSPRKDATAHLPEEPHLAGDEVPARGSRRGDAERDVPPRNTEEPRIEVPTPLGHGVRQDPVEASAPHGSGERPSDSAKDEESNAEEPQPPIETASAPCEVVVAAGVPSTRAEPGPHAPVVPSDRAPAVPLPAEETDSTGTTRWVAAGAAADQSEVEVDHPELGAVRLGVRYAKGQLDVRASTQGSAATDVVRSSEGALRERLAMAGTTLRSLAVLTMPRARVVELAKRRKKSETKES